ncbi:MAG: translation initiation factor IF-2 [Deltaproteobacteria bacterium]|jgi:translation initiation factor IF-2|nr:translation initiation factor IF-2 [Deltaproteobacteria bacterium]
MGNLGMVEEAKNEEQSSKTEVVEKRVTGTVIRRRARKSAPLPPPPVTAEVPANEAQQAVSAEVGEVAPVGAAQDVAPPQSEISEEKVVEKKVVKAEDGVADKPDDEVKDGESSVKLDGTVSDEERKIGVVGRIDLEPTQVITEKVKEDWRERIKQGRKKKKSKAELELEAIQKAGGLKRYADNVSYDQPASAVTTGDRVFQPKPSSRKRRSSRRDFKKTPLTERKAIKKVIRIEDGISVSDISQALGIKANDIIAKLMSLDIMATINQILDVETAQLIAEEAGFTVERTAFQEEEILAEPEAHASAANLASRAPVVTVMGHVDHGKTSILDIIRKSSVADGEAGGITQHIGAYEVQIPKGTITFLDTPGHEAFTMMRARGAQVTDLVILVVAADDGIMPQTIEAIDHAKAAGVPIIVAINKIDKDDAQPDRVRQSLTEHGLVPEEWGGDIICVPTSAKNNEGIDKLLEMALLQAEMLDLKADPTIRAKGIVVEARLDKGRGPVATVLIQEGTLEVGSYIVCGTHGGKIRAMFDFEGNPVKEASLSKPVEVLGLSGTPTAGDEMVGVPDDNAVRMVADQRKQKARERSLGGKVHATLEDLSARMLEGESEELGVIVKADVNGSMEAVSDALVKLSTDKVKLRVLHSAVGGIIESDIMLASASNAIVLGFNVQPDSKAKAASQEEKVEIRTYRIIYEMIDEVRKAMEGLLAPDEKEVELGTAEVRDVFKITKTGTIAGCYVTDGKIQRNAMARLLRDQVVVFEGTLSSLKRFKDDAKEVAEGYECGIGIENFNDIKVGDLIQAYIIEKTAAKL